MAKIVAPLLSLSASGSIAKSLNYGISRNANIARRARKSWHPVIIPTTARLAARAFFARAVAVGRNLDGASNEILSRAASFENMTAFNLFLKDFYHERPATLGANELGKFRFGGLTRLQ